MEWLQGYVHQDAVNMVVRRAVMKSCLQVSTVGDLINPTSDGEPAHWHLPPGTRDLGSLLCLPTDRSFGPVLTPNFDPLLSHSVRVAGGRPNLKVLDTDGALPRAVEAVEQGVIDIIHLHGYWRGSDTLHTPTQLKHHRHKLKASLQRLLRRHVLVVVAYGGWDDVFTNALTELLNDDEAEVEVMWCFREANEVIVGDQYKQLFTSVTSAITRGRFRCYGGIDCHDIFNQLLNNIPSKQLDKTRVILPHTDSTVSTDCKHSSEVAIDIVDRILTRRLDDALLAFSSQPKVWVEPIICEQPEVDKDAEAAEKIDLQTLLSTPISTIIKAPPQFGLTCLALHLAREAWRSRKLTWLYLDSKTIRPNAAAINRVVESELLLHGGTASDVKCIVLDSWSSQDKDAPKLLNKFCELYPNIPVIVMQTLDEKQFFVSENIEPPRKFKILYLWSLPRMSVRTVVSKYNEYKHIGDEDKVTTKVVSDLEVLNLHRTPFNCITMLKVSEIDFDESPVNRSEMIKRILLLLFNVDDIPTYKVRPDLKDCEYVLGYLCETILRKGTYTFTREYFLEVLDRCCKERFIDLEVQVVFDVLYANNIIIKRGYHFGFRFSFWIYYFAAQRMIHNSDFAKFILENMRYTNYPEILEFYTGIDRQREDALHVLISDIRAANSLVQEKGGVPEGLNPYRFAQWTSSGPLLESMQNEISDGVNESNLPASVKDHYADRQYDRARPYVQDIPNILAEYSYLHMVQAMRAGARALRNSDYVEPELKRELLMEIMKCWDQVSRVMMILAPILAEQGRADFNGAKYMLVGDFGETVEEKVLAIVSEIPVNVVAWFEEDLYSPKMGPLLIKELSSKMGDITKHELILMLINRRPRGWKEQVQSYISSLPHNSFFLWDAYRNLRDRYRFSYASSRTLGEIEFLIKMAAAKHVTGSKNPGIKLINKAQDAVPPREVETFSYEQPV